MPMLTLVVDVNVSPVAEEAADKIRQEAAAAESAATSGKCPPTHRGMNQF